MNKNIELYNLTNPQKNILSLSETSGKDSKLTTIFSFLKLSGNLDIQILKDTLNYIIKKNDALRINIIKKDNIQKQIIRGYTYNYIDIIDLQDKTEQEVEQYIEDNMKIPINIYDKELFKFAILQCKKSTIIIVNGSHIIYDAWAMIQVAEQIKQIYSMLNHHEDIDTLEKNSYLDFIRREDEYILSDKHVKDKDFWDNFVENIEEVKLFENSDIFNKSAKRIKKIIDSKLFNSISEYCKKNSISEYAFMLGIISVYYSKLFNLSNLTIGTPFLNRHKKYNELVTVGMFVSTLPLNIQISHESNFIALCKNIGNTNLSCYKHSSFSYLDIKDLYNKKKGNTSNLYDITFSYHVSKMNNTLDNDQGVCDWLFSDEQNNPLTISLVDFDNKKFFYYDYLTACINNQDIEMMHNRIIEIIMQVINSDKLSIKDISIFSKQDIKILKEFNNTGIANQSDKTVIDIFDDIVKRYKNKIAIKCYDSEITYEELNKKVCTLAYKLRELGVSKNTPVVLLQDKNIETIISIFAILKAGGCYVPILPEESKNRIEYIINDCKPVCILTNNTYAQKLSFETQCINVEDELKNKNSLPFDFNISNNNDLAYIIYTSRKHW